MAEFLNKIIFQFYRSLNSAVKIFWGLLVEVAGYLGLLLTAAFLLYLWLQLRSFF